MFPASRLYISYLEKSSGTVPSISRSIYIFPFTTLSTGFSGAVRSRVNSFDTYSLSSPTASIAYALTMYLPSVSPSVFQVITFSSSVPDTAPSYNGIQVCVSESADAYSTYSFARLLLSVARTLISGFIGSISPYVEYIQ